MTGNRSRISTAEHGRRFRAWLDAESCEAAAESLGITYEAFGQWRRNVGLTTCKERLQKSGLPLRVAERMVQRVESIVTTMDWLKDDATILKADIDAARKPEPTSGGGA